MSITIKKKTSGEILLWDIWWESASGHREESKGAILKAGEEDTVILKTYNDSMCFIGQSGGDREHKYYKINVESLIEFIKQSGTQVDRYSEEFQLLEKSQA